MAKQATPAATRNVPGRVRSDAQAFTTATMVAAIVVALPADVSFLDWYGYPDTSVFVGSRETKRRARDAWETLEDIGDEYGLTVCEVLDADGVDYGDYPDDAIDHSMAKEDHRNGAR